MPPCARPLRRARAEVHRAERGGGASPASSTWGGTRRRVVDPRSVLVRKAVADSSASPWISARCSAVGSGGSDGVLEDRDRVRLQRVHGDAVGAEEGRDLLALHRRAVPPRLAGADRPRRLREERQVLRAAAAADRAAAAVEEVDAHVCGGAGGEDGLLGSSAHASLPASFAEARACRRPSDESE